MRLLIADDHSLFRESLSSLLTSHGMEVVGEAKNGREAVELTRRHNPDVVLLDLTMPEMTGLEAIPQIVAACPNTRIVVLTASSEDADLFEALRLGAQGYLLKNLEADRFIDLLRRLLLGLPALSPELSRKVLHAFARGGHQAVPPKDPDALTEREKEVLELMVQGITSNRQLARRMQVSENTIKFHVRNILDKLHLHDRAQAVGHALRSKVVRVPAAAATA
jgi:DNA-binding NarL/FixJ family response regulator